jgi:hypothetical protein
MARIILHHMRQARKARAALSYVPPVPPDTFPAEEVLVRGAEEPQAESETLVRAAMPTTEETPAEQLLRSSQGQE